MKNMILFSAFISTILVSSSLAQGKEIMIINETNLKLDDFVIKASDGSDWAGFQFIEYNDDLPPTIILSIDALGDCVIDIMAVAGMKHLYWNEINLCNAIGVSLYVDENGKGFFEIEFEEEPEEDLEKN